MRILVFTLLALCSQVIAGESTIQQIEKNRELTKNVWRDLWKFKVDPRDDEVVLATLKVEPDVKFSTEGLPKAKTIESIHHVPEGAVVKFVSCTGVLAGVRKSDDDPVHRLIRIAGFGHSFDVGGELDHDGGWEVTTGEATMVFRFQDDPANPTKRLMVTLSLKRLPVSKANVQAGLRRINLPELGSTCWSITLPPIPEAVEPGGGGQPAARSESK